MSRDCTVALKGNKDGLSIYLNEELDFFTLKEKLIRKLELSGHFFKGAKVTSFQGKSLSIDQKNEIKSIINSKFGMMIEEKIEVDKINDIKKESKKTNSLVEDTEEGTTKFIRGTIRSGQSLRYEGNVVIIGDVNPGGEVIADGNILVMGALRGMAHAGAKGNETAFVVAFTLLPTQLRIASIISRPPDNEQIIPSVPELAMIKNSTIIIEPYLPKK